MNIVLFTSEELGRTIPPGDPRAKHLLQVLRRAAGSTFDAGILNGPVGKGLVRKITPEGIEWDFAAANEPPAPYAGATDLEPIELIVGMPRPQTARRILFDATAMGVRAIRFVATEKGDASYARSTLWSSGEWRRHVRAGLEQAFATREPEVTFTETLREACAAVAGFEARFALDNYEAAEALAANGRAAFPAAVLVGGERGWSADERGLFRAQGVTLCHLGKRVLRTETACVAALACLRSRLPAR
ncbi:MAG TPA: RsmE family RNA methyltransferase [Opitutaceae bacterium]|nr:RsmE family RNA methyltransferase [Opitutaceae bacterium]